MQFLNSPVAIRHKIADLIQTHEADTPIDIAVAFWGKGAEELFSNKAIKYRIICNLRSGGTNPEVIQNLIQLPNVDVKQNDRLHAKVVISHNRVVVSSANISENGLSWSDSGQSNLEAGIYFEDNSIQSQEFQEWFEQIWKTSLEITDEDLEEASQNWKKRNSTKPTKSRESSPFEPVAEQIKYHTVYQPKRGKQTFLRSAAALLALKGNNRETHNKGWMPEQLFQFLFDPEDTVLKYHTDKFETKEKRIRLKQNFLGYFIGTDGTMENCTGKPDYRKKISTEEVEELAKWMCAGGDMPRFVMQGTPKEYPHINSD